MRAKIIGQARLLRNARPGSAEVKSQVAEAIAGIDRASERLASDRPAPDRAALRGVEGAASAAYFKGYSALFPASLAFAGRNRRPPRDPVNVCLSLGYTILHNAAIHCAVSAGLDPAIGVFHDIAHRRMSLASDLMEPVRPVVDAFVLRLFKDEHLTAKSFTMRGSACKLGKTVAQHFTAVSKKKPARSTSSSTRGGAPGGRVAGIYAAKQGAWTATEAVTLRKPSYLLGLRYFRSQAAPPCPSFHAALGDASPILRICGGAQGRRTDRVVDRPRTTDRPQSGRCSALSSAELRAGRTQFFEAPSGPAAARCPKALS